MKSLNLLKKLIFILGIKGLLCLASLTVVVLALVSYTATVTIAPTTQFTIGAATASWTVYVNDVNQLRYLPGTGTPSGSLKPVLNAANTSTFAFKVVTDAAMVSAVNITLTSAVNSTKFSKFQITAMFWNSTISAWQVGTLYAAATGSTTKSYINGLTAGDSGYVHHATSLTRCYLIQVTYSYDLVDATASVNVTFRYTPLPQASF